MTDSHPVSDARRTVDVTDRACPMSFVKAKLALEEVAIGDRLEVRLLAGEARHNVPRSFEMEGQTVVSLEPEGGETDPWRLVVERAV